MDATAAAVERDAVVGREGELDRIHAFLGRRAQLPAGLVIEGPAGAGKTTIWRAGVEAARAAGYLVLSCRPTGSEVQLAHASLSDLFEGHLAGVLPSLPRPQRRALEVALLLEDDGGSPPDRRAVAAGALNALRALAREQPVLLAIDDTQWVDAPSAEVIEFALRRLGTAPVATLASRRVASPTAPSPTSAGVRPEQALERPVERVEAGPLSLGAVQRILRTRTSIDANRRMLQRIHETSGGNPFYALELARSLGSDGAAARTSASGAVEPLSLGGDLGDLLADRLDGLGGTSRDVLFVAASLSQPTLDGIASATGWAADAVREALAPAIGASVVRLNDEAIEFGHPLLATAAYNALDLGERRRWHARIAAASDDPETAARHLALAGSGPDAQVSDRLVVAARSAADRGAPTAACDLYTEALARLPGSMEAERAALVAEMAPILFHAGRADQARPLVESTIAQLDGGPLRCDLQLLLARLIENEPDAGARSLALIEGALADAGDEPSRRVAALLDLEMWERSMDHSDRALPIAREALALAEPLGEGRLLAAAHVRTADLEVVLGLGGDPIERFQRSLELGDRFPVDAEHSARSMLAVCLIRAGRLDEARPLLVGERQRATAEGDEFSQCWLSLFLAELEWFAGRWDDSFRYSTEGIEVARQASYRMREGGLESLVGLVEASRGDPDRARTQLQRSIAILEAIEEVAYGNYARQMLAFLELSLGDAEAADRHFVTYPRERLEGSKRLAFIGDAIEAMILLGRHEEASNLASELARRGEQLARPTLVATALRCRALVLGALGDMDAAVATAAEAVAAYDRLPLPFERARSLLVLGEVQRRAKQRRAARETLTEAIAAFDALGAHLWVAKAEAERARIGGRTTIEGLSETELRVARLVAEGRSNKEVAAELFVSVRAVEANLSKIYAKLGIESRTELSRRLSLP